MLNTISKEGNGKPPHEFHFPRQNSEPSLVSATLEIEYATQFFYGDVDEDYDDDVRDHYDGDDDDCDDDDCDDDYDGDDDDCDDDVSDHYDYDDDDDCDDDDCDDDDDYKHKD